MMRTLQFQKILVVCASMTLAACAHDGTYLTLQTQRTSVVRAADQAVLADAIDSAFEKIDVAKIKADLDAQMQAKAAKKEEKAQASISLPEPQLMLGDQVREDLAKLGAKIGDRMVNRLARKIRKLTDDDNAAEELRAEFVTGLQEIASDIEAKAAEQVAEEFKKLEEMISSIEVKSDKDEGSMQAMTAYVEVVSVFPLSEETLDYLRDKAGMVAASLGLRVLEVRQIFERPNPERTLEVIQIDYPDTQARVVVTVSYAGVDEDDSLLRQETHGSMKPDRVMRGRFKATLAVTPRTTAFTGVMQSIEGESAYSVVKGQYVDVRQEER